MADEFTYDVFLSHSVKDKEVVRPIAERLRADGLRVWFESWEISLVATKSRRAEKIEEGLEHSRVLVLCLSVHAFGEWAQLEASTFRFRDPLNKERRFISLRLDEAHTDVALEQFSYIKWFPEQRNQEYVKLLEACRPPVQPLTAQPSGARLEFAEEVRQLGSTFSIYDYAFSPDGSRAITAGRDNPMRLWDTKTGRLVSLFKGHTNAVWSVAWSPDQCQVLSGSSDDTVRLWNIETENCLRVFEGHHDYVRSVSWSADQRFALSGSSDKTIRLWDVETGDCLRAFEGHHSQVNSVSWSADQRLALSGSSDKTVRLWEVETGRCLRVFEGHTNLIKTVEWSLDQRRALSGSHDNSVRLWDVGTGRCLLVLGLHEGGVNSLAWSSDQRFALCATVNNIVQLWDVEIGCCLCALSGHTADIRKVAWSSDQRHVFSGDTRGSIRVWNVEEFVTAPRLEASSSILLPAPNQIQYTNAKVLLVGESGAGKTGLSKRLALNDWQPSDSTVGAWATQWKLPMSSGEAAGDGVEREIWLWDFGGQADQRLIHQLYMDETALTVLVFDGQKEDLFETLGQWDRDLTRASRKAFSKLLVAGRIDAGGLRCSRTQIEAFRKERGYLQLLETSAKTNQGCEELKRAILDSIRWEDIPWRTSPLLFKRLKEEIVGLKDSGRVLMRFNELREAMILRLLGEGVRFTDEELKAVVSLLTGPGVVWELKFGSWVLLQPERINAYAQAVIKAMREDEQERGCLSEERVLNGDLTYHSSMARLEADEERFVLLAMHQILVERGLCLREHTDRGPLLIFPSYYRRERPELAGHPAVLVSYRFNGFLDDIYATLVVRLHHTNPFRQDQLWRYAADFKTLMGKQLGVKLTRRVEGAGELEVYFDPAIEVGEKIIFSKYIHEHLLQNARDVERLRYYVCPHCGTPVGNREVAMERLGEWLEQRPAGAGIANRFKSWIGKAGAPTIVCAKCEERVPLWDELEQSFASPKIRQRVRDLQKQSALVLDNESKDRALVGEVISTVALAGQLSREFNVSDHGIDMEIEFKSDAGEATGRKLYLQLKSGDSYLRKRESDGTEVFTIKDERHARYWMSQAFPVFLVIRNSNGEVRWMEVRDYLQEASYHFMESAKQIVFDGERFDVMSVRRWRDRVLGQDIKRNS
jgi:small GTP-binding protein